MPYEETGGGPEAELGGEAHDFGPWIETPSSTRVLAFRFDHMQRALQVTWTNGRGFPYVYNNVDYEGYRSFARAKSKGKYINAVLNGHEKFKLTENEDAIPSNEKRKGISSRLRT